MSDEKEHSVLCALPSPGQRVMCFGYKTFCCKEDMDDKPEWHKVVFSFDVTSYRLKKEMPEDIEDSVIEEIHTVENWDLDEGEFDGHVIGVTKWKRLKKEEIQ